MLHWLQVNGSTTAEVASMTRPGRLQIPLIKSSILPTLESNPNYRLQWRVLRFDTSLFLFVPTLWLNITYVALNTQAAHAKFLPRYKL